MWVDARAKRHQRDHGEADGAGDDRADDRTQVIDARVLPEALVQPEGDERRRSNRDEPRNRPPEDLCRVRRQIPVESQQKGEPVRQGRRTPAAGRRWRHVSTTRARSSDAKTVQTRAILSRMCSPARTRGTLPMAAITSPCSAADRLEPLGRHKPVANSRAATAPPRSGQSRKTG